MKKMRKLVMNKKASDNVYFHPDFHIAMNMIIEYIENRYGKESVKDYLKQFARSYYRSLREKIKKRGLNPLKKYIEQLYRKEGGKIKIESTRNFLKVHIENCPALSHIGKKVPVAESFIETTKTVYETIVEKTGFVFEMPLYDKKTGRAILIFRKKQ